MTDPSFQTWGGYLDWRIAMGKQKSRARRDGRGFAVQMISDQMARVKSAHQHLARLTEGTTHGY